MKSIAGWLSEGSLTCRFPGRVRTRRGMSAHQTGTRNEGTWGRQPAAGQGCGQLSNWTPDPDRPGADHEGPKSAWSRLREAQSLGHKGEISHIIVWLYVTHICLSTAVFRGGGFQILKCLLFLDLKQHRRTNTGLKLQNQFIGRIRIHKHTRSR